MSFKIRDYSLGGFDFNDASILVTGGTGSFGKNFVRYLLEHYKPRRLVIFSRDELKQFEMAQELPESKYPCLRYFIGDVRDQARLEMAMKGVEYVVHAAALKQVPIAEYNPFECIHTNVIGAENVAQAAIRAGVKRVVALSTDKAANPINLYGASKLASDKIFVAANHLSGADGTRFSVVRYGNVVGSRGSVVPFFRKLIADGWDYIPITHEDMTRFWITLEQGIELVVSSFKLMHGGEIFIPKIYSMKVTDLAAAVAPNLPTRVIGIRPGEKLHEVMVSVDDARNTIELDDRYVIEPAFSGWRGPGGGIVGKPVDPNFEYSSNNNSEWLSIEDFHEVLKIADSTGKRDL
ncbi:UDP-N-acetylglucosamine 4,6-dehydratase (inverting) [Devosia salina]|uniref:UDP-N-acetylglucosamine 4,6-dehydratase (Inverting) n=1 Tax=Devosia salina TaxID=2860336 RepID=A0ABX8WJT2_9HYPH|nr:UDP-N-acetylglucosamine 4,6-dehydratase (inverting) [Devosia salina]QYO77777.1 UDP-N-acetylglucosamine 4,6-dehydratase (inverting) [Devosia salina]